MEKYSTRNQQSTLLVILYFIIEVGIFLAIYQFLFNRSLWIDEAMLARNIVNKEFMELLNPLDHGQAAPIGFLFLERLSVLIFGKNEMALRVFPFISFLFAIPFYYLLANRLTNNKIISLLSTSIFIILVPVLRYSSEAKQYPIDVLFAIMILYFSLIFQFKQNRSLFMYSILGVIAIWFSNTSVIILTVVGVHLLYSEYYKRKNYKIVLPFIFWTISLMIYYYFFVHDHPLAEFMRSCWADAFMPMNPFSKDPYAFIYREVVSMYHFLGFSGYYSLIPFVVSLSAIVFMIRYRKYTLLYFSIAPMAIHLLMSSFELYPFTGRFLLYTVPLITLVYSFGLYYLFDFLNKKIVRLPSLLLALPVLIMFYPVYLHFPIEIEETRQSLKYIEKNIKKDEKIYTYYGANNACKFYKETNIINIDNPIIFGTKHRGINSMYNDELLGLNGKIWMLFSHVYPWETPDDEEKYMVDFLLNNGSELLDVKEYTGSSIYYIDTKKPDSE
jgi:hypothetical protein